MSTEKVLRYERDQVTQDTFYNCGPASTQTVIRAATGHLISESELGRQMGTTTNGTPDIANILPVLRSNIPDAGYTSQYIGGNYASEIERNRLWDHLKNSIDAGYGVVANIIAPPSNYPKNTYTSVNRLHYSGGVVYHYIALMGYAIDNQGGRHVWIADSGFSPFGMWCSLGQMGDLIAGKGYIYATAQPKEDTEMSQMSEEIGRIYHELTHQFQTRYKVAGKLAEYRDTLVGYVLNNDEKLTRLLDDRLPVLEEKIDRLLEEKANSK